MLVRPDPDNETLYERISCVDQNGRTLEAAIINERPLTIFLNGREIVTAMTIGDFPDHLAIGYLLNQNMLRADDVITAVDHDRELDVVVVRTERETDYEEKLKKKIQTSGCAMGTVFGDVMESFETARLDPDTRFHTAWLRDLLRTVNTMPRLYLTTGAIHGCVLCEGPEPLVFMEDVGRHNAIDKLAGYMFRHGIRPEGKTLYTTGRLTSEMVIKTVQMGVPVLLSRSGFTAWGVQLARRVGLTLIGRARGRRFLALSGLERIVFDAEPVHASGIDPDKAHLDGRDDE